MSGKKKEAAIVAARLRAAEAAETAATTAATAAATSAAALTQQQLIFDLQSRLAAMELKSEALPPLRRLYADDDDWGRPAAAERPASFKLPQRSGYVV